MIIKETQKTKLLFVERPKFNESYQGYILRLTHLNGYEKINWIYELMENVNGYNRKRSTLSQELKALKDVTSLEIYQLQNLLFRSLGEEEYNELLGYTQQRKCKICPKCLDEKKYYNGIWEIAFITECTEHNCLLVEKCPNCNKMIGWNRCNLFYCNCQFDLRKCKVEDSEENSSKITSLIISKVRMSSLQKSSTTNPLYELDLISLLKVMNFICLKLVFSIKHGGKVPFKLMENSEMHILVNNAFKVFENWPANFYTFLENLKLEEGMRNRGIVKDFGSFYRRIKSYKQFDFLFNAFKYYVFLNKGKYISHSFTKLFNGDLDEFDHITGTEAANVLGLKLSTVQKLMNNNILTGIVNVSNHFTTSLVNKKSVDVLKYKLENWYSQRKTREILNIDEHVFLSFINFIEHIEIPYKSGAIRRYFNPKCVENILKELDEKLVSIPSNLITIENSIKLINGASGSYSFLQIYHDILQNRLVPRGIDNNSIGIRRYLFCKDEIKNFAQQKVKELDLNNYSLSEATKLLGIRQGDLWVYIKKGIIKVDKIKSRQRIPISEIGNFKDTYVDLSEIRKTYKFNFHPTVNTLTEKGVLPIMGPTIDGHRKYWFLRDAIDNLSCD